MRRHCLLTVLLLVLGIAPIMQASAQERDPDAIEKMMAAQVDTLVQQLSLTAEQEAPVREVLMAQYEQGIMLRRSARNSESRRDVRQRVGALQEETNTKLKELLTEEQMATYKKITQNRRGRRQGQRRGYR